MNCQLLLDIQDFHSDHTYLSAILIIASPFTDVCICIYVYVLMLHINLRAYIYFSVVTITQSPENTTVCRGSEVTISCGYQFASALAVTWIINDTSFDLSTIASNPSSYQLNFTHTAQSKTFLLTVFSINGNTTFQCALHSDPITTSTTGTVTVISM